MPRSQDILESIPQLAELAKNADHIDVKYASSRAGLREFIADSLNWKPGWVTTLFNLRRKLAAILGLKQVEFKRALLSPEDIPFSPGEDLSFFQVIDCHEGKWLAGGATDSHLRGVVVFVCQPGDRGINELALATVVHYRDWRGPFYFNLIRPFHHLIVNGMIKHAAAEHS